MHAYLTDSYAPSEKLYSLLFTICFRDERNKKAKSIQQLLKNHVFFFNYNYFTFVLCCIWCQFFTLKIWRKKKENTSKLWSIFLHGMTFLTVLHTATEAFSTHRLHFHWFILLCFLFLRESVVPVLKQIKQSELVRKHDPNDCIQGKP